MRNSLTLIISPIDQCNLACKYCTPARLRTGTRMSFATLENSLIKTVEYSKRHNKSTRFIWHGGEPLVVGMDFYEKVIDVTRFLVSKGYQITHAMQTNGTLLTPERAIFFVENNFNISFSLDGQKILNDRTRIYGDGSSTYEDTIKGILTYKKLKGFASVISVLSSANIINAVEIYKYFTSMGIFLQFNPWFDKPDSENKLQISAQEFGNALKKLFNVWFSEKNPTTRGDSDFMEDFLTMCLFEKPVGCIFRKNCQLDDIYSIDPEGGVGPCSRFFGNKSFLFGNINEGHDFDEIASSEKRVELQRRHEIIKECNECRYQIICNSGCMYHAFERFGTVNAKDPMCFAYKTIFSHVNSVTRKHLDLSNDEKEIKNEFPQQIN